MTKVKVITPLLHDGQLYDPGDSVELNDKQVKALAGTVENPEVKSKDVDVEAERETDQMTRAELNDYAKSLGIENPEGFPTKADLLDEISQKEEQANKK
jgi:hypothetical protein